MIVCSLSHFVTPHWAWGKCITFCSTCISLCAYRHYRKPDLYSPALDEHYVMHVPHDSYVEWELVCACLYTQSADSFTIEVVIQYTSGWELKLSRRSRVTLVIRSDYKSAPADCKYN